VHERGYRSAIFNLGVLGGINLAQPIGKFARLILKDSFADFKLQLELLFSTVATKLRSMPWVVLLVLHSS
jgi:hypothetical protein